MNGGGFEIDFEWPVAAKYELRPATDKHVAKTHELRPWIEDVPKNDWPMYLGRIVPVTECKLHRPKAEVMERAVRVLVECRKTPFHKVALTVVRAIGTQFGDEGDEVEYWDSCARHLRRMFEGIVHDFDVVEERLIYPIEYKWPHPKTQRVGNLGVFLVPAVKGNRPVLALRPTTPGDALSLYAARMIATGTTFNICEHCNTPFLSGGIRGRNKRGDSKFCSSECRWKWHNETRRKAR
jgi:hypothetical protein